MPASNTTGFPDGHEELAAHARRLPIGAELLDRNTTHFGVWAPAVSGLTVITGDREVARLAPEDCGYFSGLASLKAGDRYAFRLDGDDRLYPDPASRFQPAGP